jgi:rare lipoprotein A
VVLRPIYGAAALVVMAIALAAGCGKRVATHAPPSPPKPAPVGWTETGIASWYGAPYDGRPAASGEIFDTHRLTAAHRTLPFDTWVEVTNLQNGRRVQVRINDRGPFIDGRIVDLSFAAADAIDLVRPGIGRVRLKVIRAPKQEPLAKRNEPADPEPPTKQDERPRKTEPPNKDEPPNNDVRVDQDVPAKKDEPAIDSSSIAQFASAGEFAVQAGAFSESARADGQAAKLSRFSPRVVKSAGEPMLWRVLVGRKMTRETAEALAVQIRATGSDAVVVRDVK